MEPWIRWPSDQVAQPLARAIPFSAVSDPGSLVGDHDARFDPRNTASRGDVCDAGAYDTGGSATTVPGEPAVSAIAGDGTATVSWTQPANNGGQKVYKYEVECVPGCGAQDVDANTFSTTISGLQNHQRYVFLVAAISKAGIGAAGTSNSVTPVTNWYVNADSGQDPSSGCAGNSQTAPYQTIAYVLNSCAVNGDIIHLESPRSKSYDGNLTISKDVTIQGDSPTGAAISGGTPVVSIPSGATVTLEGVTITGGGQGIENQGNLTVKDSRITGNGGSTTKAGAILNNGGSLTLDSSTVDGNNGSWTGGIWSTKSGASLNILNSTIANNSRDVPALAASAIYVDGGSASLTGDTITRNHGESTGADAIEQGLASDYQWEVSGFSRNEHDRRRELRARGVHGLRLRHISGTGFTGSYDLIGGANGCPGFGNDGSATRPIT